MNRFMVVGGGIVGLATARALLAERPGAAVTVLEREPALAVHQTGRNSGVIHSGIYYPPGSAKARMCKAGAASITDYARANSIPVIATGKLILATATAELSRLRALYERGIANGIEVHWLERREAQEYEPNCACIAAVRVPATAITDYPAICQAMARDITRAGGTIRTSIAVTGIVRRPSVTIVQTTAGTFETDVLVNCAGLQSDRIADLDRPDDRGALAVSGGSRFRRASGGGARSGGGAQGADGAPDANEGARIVPFRGEYYQLRPDRSHLVKGLIYPVPNPDFPFLGVHLTKMVDGSVHAGPNAVLALAREGYDWRTIDPRDVRDVLAFGGFWQLARRNYRPGLAEVARSLSKKRFAESLARLVPEITADDLVPSEAGVRAQALRTDGGLVDDFLIVQRPRAVHVLNAPSPAATSSLEIGRRVAELAVASDGDVPGR